MAQTTTAVDSVNALASISDGTLLGGVLVWTNVSGSLVSITPGAQNRAVGKANTVDGDKPIVRRGKRDVQTITINGLYTPTAGELYKVLKAIWDANGDCYLRWQYSTSGTDDLFVTENGFLNSFTDPKVDASDPNPVPFQAILTTPGTDVSQVSAS